MGVALSIADVMLLTRVSTRPPPRTRAAEGFSLLFHLSSARRKDKTIARAHDDKVDAQRLTPGALLAESEYVQQLQDEMKRIDEDLTEAEAKNRLYYLLGERTRCARGD